MKIDLEANKQNAISFYQTAYLGKPRTAVEKFVGKDIEEYPAMTSGYRKVSVRSLCGHLVSCRGLYFANYADPA